MAATYLSPTLGVAASRPEQARARGINAAAASAMNSAASSRSASPAPPGAVAAATAAARDAAPASAELAAKLEGLLSAAPAEQQARCNLPIRDLLPDIFWLD